MTQHVNFLGKYIFEDIKTENSLIYKKIRFTNLKEIFEMKKFGDSNKFGIQYSFLENPFNEKGVFGESWGEFKLFINGSDICEYLEEKESKTYTWNLYFIIEWLCENLEFILGYDDFPLPVKGENILELVDAANNFEIEDELEEYFSENRMSLIRVKYFVVEQFIENLIENFEGLSCSEDKVSYILMKYIAT